MNIWIRVTGRRTDVCPDAWKYHTIAPDDIHTYIVDRALGVASQAASPVAIVLMFTIYNTFYIINLIVGRLFESKRLSFCPSQGCAWHRQDAIPVFS